MHPVITVFDKSYFLVKENYTDTYFIWSMNDSGLVYGQCPLYKPNWKIWKKAFMQKLYGEVGGMAGIGRFYRSALPLGGWSYIMETYNIPVEEVSSLMFPS